LFSRNYFIAFLLAFAALTIGVALLAASSLSRWVSFAVRAIAAVASSNREAKSELAAPSDETILALTLFRSEGVSAQACAEPRDRRAKLMTIILMIDAPCCGAVRRWYEGYVAGPRSGAP
jgi:hypothetical protein